MEKEPPARKKRGWCAPGSDAIKECPEWERQWFKQRWIRGCTSALLLCSL